VAELRAVRVAEVGRVAGARVEVEVEVRCKGREAEFFGGLSEPSGLSPSACKVSSEESSIPMTKLGGNKVIYPKREVKEIPVIGLALTNTTLMVGYAKVVT